MFMVILSDWVRHLRVNQLSEALSLSQKFKISVRTPPQKTHCVFIVSTNAVNENYLSLLVASSETHECCVYCLEKLPNFLQLNYVIFILISMP
jgi:hypothetical protein